MDDIKDVVEVGLKYMGNFYHYLKELGAFRNPMSLLVAILTLRRGPQLLDNRKSFDECSEAAKTEGFSEVAHRLA